MNIVDIVLKVRPLARVFSESLLLTSGLVIVLALIVLAVFAPLVTPYSPYEKVGDPYIPPFVDLRYPLGTNFMGQDVLTRLLYGARNSLLVALLAVTMAASIGIPLGIFAPYVGGKIERIITFLMDSLYAFPGIILALTITFIIGPGLVNVAIALAVIYIPTYYRVIRSATLTVKEQLYVEAARAAGASTWTMIARYIAPNVIPVVVPVLALNFADAIITEAGLSFLGVGLPPTEPDWGVDLSISRGDIVRGVWWTTFFPGLMIFIATFGFLLLGEGLGERLRR